ncbi:PTS system mannose/fructose/sorbose family transporter subunit IID [Amphibacillus sp. Q70]|uniref:PTS system mannose/fructose/sorbose family transporter subunit IID n=1 Tax=Amphibacillus sp. Q70 TaxID=3453416 RepID=UPI003F862E46
MSKLTKKDLNKVVRRWMLMAVNTFNYQSQQAGSVVFSLKPALRKIYKKDEELQESIQNHFKFFNCMPWLAPLVLGATLAMEDRDGIKAKDIVQNTKTSLMGPLSGVGDSIFWVLIPTILGSIAGYMAIDHNPVGVILWMIINIVFMFLRAKAIHIGFNQGTKLITTFGDKISILTECASILGLVVVGALVPSVVDVSTPLIIERGELSMEIQPLLDSILPALLPVIFTYLIYKLIQSKKMGISLIILLVIIVSMLGAWSGLLG